MNLIAGALLALAQADPPDVRPILEKLGVVLKVTSRPPWPKPPAASISVTLAPQTEAPGPHVVSFGLPFGPDVLADDRRIRVTEPGGRELAVYSEPLAFWGLDGKKGSLRSVLVQFEAQGIRRVTVTWDAPRTQVRGRRTPTPETQLVQDSFQVPKILAILPADWLCASLVAWQQTPAAANRAAPWFDQHLVEQFPGSLPNITTKSVEAHLYDRPATYAKIYVRYGEEKYLLAALKANDFYIQHLGADGFFDLKPGDAKYVYTEGSALMYLLTGDERYKHAVTRSLKSWALWKRIEYKGQGFWTERHAGTGLAAYLHAYELDGDPDHLALARRYFEAVYALQVSPLDGQPPDGAWLHKGASHGDGNGWTTSPWMSALLMDGIWKLWMTTGDARCPASLAMYAKFLEKHAVTADRKGVYYMANSPGRGKSDNPESPPHNMEICYELAMGHWLSGGADAGLLETFNSLWPPLLKDGANRPGRKFNWRFRETSMLVWFLQNGVERKSSLREINPPAAPAPGPARAIVGATLVDGRGGPPVADSVVVLQGNRIAAAGPRSSTAIPEGADIVRAEGRTLLPGFIDAHFHVERDYDLPGIFLSRGVTSIRDPGQWIEVYEPVRQAKEPRPRCFVTGPHLDGSPPAHPRDALVIEDEAAARAAVLRFADQGASAIKVYFRLPLGSIRAACEAASERNLPVTAHLELVDAGPAIRAGLSGVEHITSFGTALASPEEAERFRQDVSKSNAARGKGRYELWSRLDLDQNPRVAPLLDLLVRQKTFVSATLAIFERREGDRGFENMLRFAGMCHRAGVTLVVGSHSQVPKAGRGWAYARELELLVESGMTPLEAITAATLQNARFFRVDDRLGTVEAGKLADLVLVEGDVSKDIRAVRQVRGVMLNGLWAVGP